MRTAVDSSVLLLILRQQAGAEQWRHTLSRAAAEGVLVLCPVVFAECSVGFSSATEAQKRFDELGILHEGFTPESAWLAGHIFLQYRKKQGPREHLLPDFLIAAHATVQADRLAALDRGYVRAYFPQLRWLAP